MDDRRARPDRGSGSVMMAAVVAVVALATVVVARVVVAAAEQAAAQHAADAAALAGVSGGPAAAREVAAANGATVVEVTLGPGQAGGTRRVSVTVRRGDRTARATAEGDRRARRDPGDRGVWHPGDDPGALRSTKCPMATSVRRPPTPRTPTRTPMRL